jgi:hypothetical protein
VKGHPLVGAEVEVGKVVVLGTDAVAGLLVEGVDLLQADGHPDTPQRVLVPLELPPVGLLALGIARDPFGDLLQGDWPPGFEQDGDEVRQALQTVGHRRHGRGGLPCPV